MMTTLEVSTVIITTQRISSLLRFIFHTILNLFSSRTSLLGEILY